MRRVWLVLLLAACGEKVPNKEWVLQPEQDPYRVHLDHPWSGADVRLVTMPGVRCVVLLSSGSSKQDQLECDWSEVTAEKVP